MKVDDGLYRIYTKVTEDTSCVEVKDASSSSGANVQQWEENGHNCQVWRLTTIESLSASESTDSSDNQTSTETEESTEETTQTEDSSTSSGTVVSDAISVTAKIVSDWGSGATVEFILTNDTGFSFENGWTIQLTTNREIMQLWNNGLVSLGDNVYQISNPSWDTSWSDGEKITVSGALGEGSGVLTISDVAIVN